MGQNKAHYPICVVRSNVPYEEIPSDPLYDGEPQKGSKFPVAVSTPLSLNIFYQTQQRRLCVSNCRSIETVVLYPLYSPGPPKPGNFCSSLHAKPSLGNLALSIEKSSQVLEHTKMFGVQAQDPMVNLTTTTITSHDKNCQSSTIQEAFRFLDLPFELRLKIYGYLLPSRAHTIVTQIPHNGFFYNTSSIPANSATSFYPFGRVAPTSTQARYTTYKVLTTNFRTDFPLPSIHPELLLVSKQIHAEAEPVLYGNHTTIWDFGVHLDALMAFWGDRSEVARKCVKSVRVARQVPLAVSAERGEYDGVDQLWVKVCNFVKGEMTGLQSLDLTIWSSDSFTASFPSPIVTTTDSAPPLWEEQDLLQKQNDLELKWREWEWTAELLNLPTMAMAKVTFWDFPSPKGNGEETNASGKNFNSWIAGRMVADRLVRDRMLRDGVAVEGVVMLRGINF